MFSATKIGAEGAKNMKTVSPDKIQFQWKVQSTKAKQKINYSLLRVLGASAVIKKARRLSYRRAQTSLMIVRDLAGGNSRFQFNNVLSMCNSL